VSAEDNLSYEQLAMFMTPKEIKSKYDVSEGEYSDDEHEPDQLYARKRREAKKSGLFKKVRKEGVQIPVQLSSADKTIADGYHRVASERDNRLMPVEHLEPEEIWWRSR
jgi:hypothetical protein